MTTKTHEQIMAESGEARKAAAKESSIWAAGTSATAEELEAAYEDYVVEQLEAGNDDYGNFQTWAEFVYGISNES